MKYLSPVWAKVFPKLKTFKYVDLDVDVKNDFY